MSWNISDKVLWATVLFTAGFAYAYLPATLNRVRDLAAIPDGAEVGPKKQLQKHAEQAISPETLRKLSDGYSYEIRSAAIKLTATRVLKPRTKLLILQDLESKDNERRYNAICGLRLLLSHSAVNDQRVVPQLVSHRAFEALITALVNLLELHNDPSSEAILSTPRSSTLPPSPVYPMNRPLHECLLLPILQVLMSASRPADQVDEPMDMALKAGLVTKWLKHYPFPCALPENSHLNFKKVDVCNLLERKIWGGDFSDMASLVQTIVAHGPGKHQLQEVGLCYAEDHYSHSQRRRELMLEIDADVRMVNGESTAGATTPPIIRELLDSARDEAPRVRTQEYSPEEENLRQRRREAIVVAEPGVPLSQDNILQRQDSRTDHRNVANDF